MTEPRVLVGYAWFFERIVVYGSFSHVTSLFRSKRMRTKAGKFLGVVKGLIPADPFRVLYEYHKHTKGFKKRAWLRKRTAIKAYFRNLKREKKEAHVWNSQDHGVEQRCKYAKQATLGETTPQ